MKRALLGHLTRDELLAIANRIHLAAPEGSTADGVSDALVGRGVSLHQILPTLTRARKKHVCRALGLEDRGRDGCVVVE